MKKRGISILTSTIKKIIIPKSKRSQIWVETVIYTLIAFVMIGLVLGFVAPKIRELQDRAIIEQTNTMLKDIDLTILTMGGSGNRRIMDISIKKGNFDIDGVNDRLFFEMESEYEYSEPGLIVKDSGISIETTKKGKFYIVDLTKGYSDDYNITYDGKKEIETLSKSPIAYTVLISNKGQQKSEIYSTCTSTAECPDAVGYTKSCDDDADVCRYTENRVTIDFKLM